MISPVFLLIEWEYWCRHSVICCAISGDVELSSGRMLWWLHDVRIQFFCGLIKHPRALPNLFNSVRKKMISLWQICRQCRRRVE